MEPINKLKLESPKGDIGYKFFLYPNGQMKIVFAQQYGQEIEKRLEGSEVFEAIELIDYLLNLDLEDNFEESYIVVNGDVEDFAEKVREIII